MTKLRNWLQSAAIIESPSVMTAAGHKIQKDGSVKMDPSDEDTSTLRKNLALIGTSAIIANPATISGTWSVLNHPITNAVGMVTGLRDLFTSRGVQKTYNHLKNKEWFPGIISAVGDAINISPWITLGRSAKSAYKIFRNNSAEQLNTFDDVIDSAVSYWRRHIDSNVKRTDFDILESKKIDDLEGGYNPITRSIRVNVGSNKNSQRHALIHEMRHHEDYDLNNEASNDLFSAFTLDDSVNGILGQTYGRLHITPDEKKVLNKIYSDVPGIEERVAVNTDFRALLDNFAQRELGRIPSKEALDNYIQDLPWPILLTGRMASGYSSNRSVLPIFVTPGKTRSALINIK